MDLPTLLSWWTVILLGLFLGIVAWVWVFKRKSDFDTAARMPLEDDDGNGSGRDRGGCQ